MVSTLDLDKTLGEGEYRRGYCDGWVQAIQALDRLLERGFSRSLSYSRVYDHWHGALAEWRTLAPARSAGEDDAGEVELPPAVKV